MEPKRLRTPLTDADVEGLHAGDPVTITGVIYGARDAAHKRLVEAIDRGEALPVELQGQIIYYVGPTPAKPGQVIGAAGPTTSIRMDPYTPALLARGLKGMIGKGFRSGAVRAALQQHKAVYLAATGGAGALLARRIRKAEVVAYEDLGPEALFRFEVEDFPAIVVNDAFGGDLYATGKEMFRKGMEALA
ncbi:MAG: Fe-S-containing hydro-lyase [Armatimonadota bacterium]|nr:Fe-S-containing hydro-lyase [Armatimonadota bacterium]